MISPNDFGDLPRAIELQADAPVRVAKPQGRNSSGWSSLRGAVWLQLGPRRTEVNRADDAEASARLAFSAGSGTFAARPPAAWVWKAPETMAFIAGVLEDIHAALDASLPRLPLAYSVFVPDRPALDWPEVVQAKELRAARRLQRKRLGALRDFAESLNDRREAETREPTGAMDRLEAALATIPRPGKARVTVEKGDGPPEALHIDWRLSGDLNLLCGASYLALGEDGNKIVLLERDAETRKARRDAMAQLYVLSMADAFARALGPCTRHVTFRTLLDLPAGPSEASLSVSPEDWGFELMRRQVEFTTSKVFDPTG